MRLFPLAQTAVCPRRQGQKLRDGPAPFLRKFVVCFQENSRQFVEPHVICPRLTQRNRGCIIPRWPQGVPSALAMLLIQRLIPVDKFPGAFRHVRIRERIGAFRERRRVFALFSFFLYIGVVWCGVVMGDVPLWSLERVRNAFRNLSW